MVRSFTLGIGENRSQDTYTENVYENSDVGTSFEQIANVTGINSQTLFRTALVEKSEGWSDEDHVGQSIQSQVKLSMDILVVLKSLLIRILTSKKMEMNTQLQQMRMEHLRLMLLAILMLV